MVIENREEIEVIIKDLIRRDKDKLFGGLSLDAGGRMLENRLPNLSKPSRNGQPLRRTTKLTEDNLEVVYDVTKSQNGFPNRTDSTVTWSDSSPDRTLTISPSGTSFDYYMVGVKYTKSAAETIQITDSAGLWLFYYDGDTLTSQQNPTSAQIETVLLTKAWIAFVYWDAVNNKGKLFEERHGISMSPKTHRELHFTIGTTFFDGLALGDFSIDGDGSSNSHAQFSVAAGQIFDQDIKHTINAINSTTGLEVWHRNGSLDWTWDTQAGYSVLNASSGRVYYDNAGTLTEVTDGKWVLYHIFAWNAKDGNPIVIMGQAEYSTKKAAQSGAVSEINSLYLGALPSTEMIAIASGIVQTKNTYGNAVKARMVSTEEGDDYVDLRLARLSPSAPSQDHGLMSGLLDDDHSGNAWLAGRSGGQTLIGSTLTGEDLTLKDNSVDNNIVTVTQIISAHADVATNTADLQPFVHLRKNQQQVIGHAADTVIDFDASDVEESDTLGFHNPASNSTRLTVPSGYAGSYLITGVISYTGDNTGERGLLFKKNGGAAGADSYISYTSYSVVGAGVARISISAIVSLVATDYIEMVTYQSSGGDLNTLSLADGAWNPTEIRMMRIAKGVAS